MRLTSDQYNVLLGATNTAISSITVKRRDSSLFEIRFYNSAGSPRLLPEGHGLRFGAKVGYGDAGYTIYSDAWTAPSGEGNFYYAGSPNFNTTELNTLFATEPAEVALKGEFSWTESGKIVSTNVVTIKVSNDIIRGGEVPPTSAVAPYPDAPIIGTVLVGEDDGDGNAVWAQKTYAQLMSLLSMLPLTAVTGEAGALDTLVTAGGAIANGVTVRVLTGSLDDETIVQAEWTLVAGTHANGDNWRQPLDYHVDTNNRTWVKTR